MAIHTLKRNGHIVATNLSIAQCKDIAHTFANINLVTSVMTIERIGDAQERIWEYDSKTNSFVLKR